MNAINEVVEEFEAKGGELALKAGSVRIGYPPERKGQLWPILEALRANRQQVAEILLERQGFPAPAVCPPLPAGVKLIRYRPKAPPAAVAPVYVVTDVNRFIAAYLNDLSKRLTEPSTHACAPLPEILAKLAAVGVELTLTGNDR